jgi:hypothetical protein
VTPTREWLTARLTGLAVSASLESLTLAVALLEALPGRDISPAALMAAQRAREDETDDPKRTVGPWKEVDGGWMTVRETPDRANYAACASDGAWTVYPYEETPDPEGADDPGNFIKSIWLDPKITKFVPFDHAEKPIFDNEKWEMTDIMVGECPNVLFYRRNEHFDPSQYLNESTFNWGEHSDSKDALGNKGGRSVMLVAIKLLYYLGVRNIFLLGCDFKMDENTKYHFDQDRSTGSQKGNNSTYHILKSRFDALKPYFDQVGLNVYNCNPDSGLKTFPFMSFQDAVNIATKDIPNIYTERTSGLYDRKANEKNKKQETKQDNKQSIDLTKTEFSENEKTLTKQELDRLRKKLNDLKHAKEIYVKMPDRNIETLNKLEEQISIARKEFREYEIIKNKVWGIPK